MMKQFLISFITLICFVNLAFAADLSVEDQLKTLDLAGKVNFSMGEAKDFAEFRKLDDTQSRHVDSDLMKKNNMRRLSSVFMSSDGAYVITTGKDLTTNQIKTILFVQVDNQNKIFADNIIEVKRNEIKNSHGSFLVNQ